MNNKLMVAFLISAFSASSVYAQEPSVESTISYINTHFSHCYVPNGAFSRETNYEWNVAGENIYLVEYRTIGRIDRGISAGRGGS